MLTEMLISCWDAIIVSLPSHQVLSLSTSPLGLIQLPVTAGRCWKFRDLHGMPVHPLPSGHSVHAVLGKGLCSLPTGLARLGWQAQWVDITVRWLPVSHSESHQVLVMTFSFPVIILDEVLKFFGRQYQKHKDDPCLILSPSLGIPGFAMQLPQDQNNIDEIELK